MSSWLKAGLIGLAVLAVLSLFSLIPVVGLCILPLRWITYLVVGILAASYMAPPRQAGKAAGQGALSGMVAAAGGGLVSLIISLIQASMGTGARKMAQVIRQLPPEVIRQLREAGIPLRELLGRAAAGGAGIGGIAACSSVCCLGGIVLAAALAALGAVLYAGTNPGEAAPRQENVS